jgi:aminoglycoside phosphotransferase (APT) family kinase protein
MMTVKADIHNGIRSRIAEAWPGTTLVEEPTPLTGGFWASMYRLRLEGQPQAVPPDVVFRIAPDAVMGAKELTVQQTVADLGFSTPHVWLAGSADDIGGTWSVMDFAAGTAPLGGLDGFAALRQAPGLLGRLSAQLALPMAGLHALDPEPVSTAVAAAAPTVAWSVDNLLTNFEASAEIHRRSDLIAAVRALADRRFAEGETVICHGDLHPFNLLIDGDGAVTVVDWTAAIRAEPAYDVAFTELLLANPPLDASGPLGAVIRWIGVHLARRFVARYRAVAPHHDLGMLAWYRGLHGLRILLEAASLENAEGSVPGGHPFTALAPAAASTLSAVTGLPIQTRNT